MEIEIDRYLKMKERRGRRRFQSNRIVKIVSDDEGSSGDRRKVERRDRKVARFSSKRIVSFRTDSIDRKSSKKRCYIDLCEDEATVTCQQGTSYYPM